MPLTVAHRARCDRPGCGYAVMLPHASARSCRAQLDALGWLLIRWRRKKPGTVRVIDRWGSLGHLNATASRVKRADVGGSGRILYLCQLHRGWRPRTGRELPLPAIPRFK